MKQDMNVAEVLTQLAALRAAQKSLEQQVKAIEDQVKDYMKENDTYEIECGGHKATWKEVTSQRFNQAEFKKYNQLLYKNYTTVNCSRRFVFS